MKNLSLILFCLLILVRPAAAQLNMVQNYGETSTQNLSLIKDENNGTRKVFIYSSLGVMEIFSIGAGYQISDRFAFSINGSASFTGLGKQNFFWLFFPTGSGIGFKLSYYTPSVFFSAISFEYVAYLDLDENPFAKSVTKGGFYDLTIGREFIYDKGFNFFWSIGICVSDALNSNTVIFPSLKAGIEYNIF